jgi:hypothetical protein
VGFAFRQPNRRLCSAWTPSTAFFLAERQSEVSFSSGGRPVLAQPFRNAMLGKPDATLVAAQIDPVINVSQFPIRSGNGPLKGPSPPGAKNFRN